MPTETWKKDRRLLTFWVTREEAVAFHVACAAADKTQAEVLRETVQVLIGGNSHACASLEEARQKQCEICLSRLP